MAITQFYEDLFVKTIDTSETPNCGSFTFTNDMELSNVQLMLFINGTLGGSETATIKLQSQNNNDMYTSTTLNLASQLSSEESVTGDWLGYVKFDFDREHINSSFTYNVELSFSNYTRNGDTFYISFVYDWPYTINASSPTVGGANMKFYGYKEI